jgi:anti-anti-sigma factor
MNAILSQTDDLLLIEPSELHELVRGQEQAIVTRLTPLVRRQSLTLDLTHVERIDAAGIAALISLYGCAHAAGNDFRVANASARVAEILVLVGLDRVLVSQDAASHDAVRSSQPEPCFAQPAA